MMQGNIAVTIMHRGEYLDATLTPAGDFVWRETLTEQADRLRRQQVARERAAWERLWSDRDYNPGRVWGE